MAIAETTPKRRRDPVGVCTEWMPVPSDEESDQAEAEAAPPPVEPHFPPGRRRFMRVDERPKDSPVFPGEPF